MTGASKVRLVARVMAVLTVVSLAQGLGPPAGAVGTGAFTAHPTAPSFGARPVARIGLRVRNEGAAIRQLLPLPNNKHRSMKEIDAATA